MRKLHLTFAAAALAVAAASGGVAPADATGVTVRAGENGVGVRIGDTRPRGYYIYEGRQCRTLIERKKRANGTVVETKTRVCD
jgi:hypothetical protein